MDAAAALARLVEAENAALAAMDLAAAASLAPAKRAACEALATAPRPPDGPAPRAMAARLDALAARNRTLLERGIAAQGQIIGMIAEAARAAMPRPAYGPVAGKGTAKPAAARPWSFSARV